MMSGGMMGGMGLVGLVVLNHSYFGYAALVKYLFSR
jgi:hypothetical protein